MEDKFDKFIKDSLNNYDVQYNPEHWKRIERQLDNRSGAGRYLMAGVVSVVVITGAMLFMQDREESVPTPATEVAKAAPAVPVSNREAAPEKDIPEASVAENRTELSSVNGSQALPTSEPAAPTTLENKVKEQENTSVPAAPKPKQTGSALAATISVSRQQGCVSEPFHFNSEVNVPATYLWSFGDGHTSTLPSPSHAYGQAGKYSVSLKVTSLLDGKTLRTTEGGVVVVNPKPTARFAWNVDEENNFSRRVEFTNHTRNTIYNQWIIDGKPYTDENITLKFNRKGSYKAALIVKNELGCYDTLMQNVVLDKDYNLLAPTAFTPNDDNQNDDFLPALLRSGEVDFRMEVLDPKTGNIIFNSSKRPWNGMNQTTGAKADEGTYIWVITLTRADNSKETFKGNVSLLR